MSPMHQKDWSGMVTQTLVSVAMCESCRAGWVSALLLQTVGPPGSGNGQARTSDQVKPSSGMARILPTCGGVGVSGLVSVTVVAGRCKGTTGGERPSERSIA